MTTTATIKPANTVAEFTNAETNMTAFVMESKSQKFPGYHVTLRDDDSGNYLPSTLGIRDLEAAKAKAQSLVAI